MMIVSGR